MGFIDFFAKYIKPVKLRGTGCLHPRQSGWLSPQIASIRQQDVNLWVVKTGQGGLLFDTGYQQFAAGLAQAFKRLELDPSQFKAVFLTHADVDHAGGLVGGLREVLPPPADCPVFLLRDEAAMLSGQEVRFRKGPLRLKNPLVYSGPVEYLEDGQILEVAGIKVRVIHTPGHTPGHACYLLEGECFDAAFGGSVLVSGDCMAFNGSGGYGFFPMFNLDTARNQQSIAGLRDKLAGRKIGAVLSGHSGCYRGEQTFAHVDEVASGSKHHPFDATAPIDVFNPSRQ